MRVKGIIACCLSVSLLASAYPGTFAQEDKIGNESVAYQETENVEYAPGELIVKYAPETATLSEDEVEPSITLSNDEKIEVLDTLSKDESGRTQVWKIETDDIKAAARELEQMPGVEYAEPNYKITLDSLSYDKDFDEQWGLLNPDGYDINIRDVWESMYDNNQNYINDITVAVLDTGIDIYHPDLRNNIFVNTAEKNGGMSTDDDGNGYVDDVTGWNFTNNTNIVYDNEIDSQGANEDRHGTHIAGIIAAELNEKGVQGVAYDHVNILPIKFLNGCDSGYIDDAIKGIQYAEEMGASIINCSWGCKGISYSLKDVIAKSRMLFVCSAGNDSQRIDYYSPAGFERELDNVVAVTALDSKGQCADFSNYGSNTIGAPGVDIISTLPDNSYGTLSGTSMAAPFVAGTAALIKSSSGNLSAKELKKLIFNGHNEIGESEFFYCKLDAYRAFSGKISSSIDKFKIRGIRQYGGGILASNSKLYSLGGYNQDGYITDIKIYNPVTQEWSIRAIPSAKKRIFSSYSEYYGLIFSIGGRNNITEFEDFMEYDTVYDDYDKHYDGIYREPVSGTAFVIADNNYFYVCGGIAGGEYIDHIWYAINVMYPAGYRYIEMPEKRGYGCAQYLNGYLYIFGGSNENGCLDTTYKYDITTKTWTECAKTNGYHNNGKSIVRNGKIYLFGGSTQFTADGHDNVVEASDEISFDTFSNTVEEYDPATDTWTLMPDMDMARSGFSVVDYYGDIMIMGGWNGEYIEDVEYYWGIDRPNHIKGKYTNDKNKYTLSWDEVVGATGYDVEINGVIYQEEAEYMGNINWEKNQQIRVRAVKDDKKGSWSKYITVAKAGTSMDTAESIEWNQAVSGVLAGSEQSKWFAVRTETLSDANITLSDLPEEHSFGLKLYDRYGKLIAAGLDSTGKVKISNYLLTDDMYYIEVYTMDELDTDITFNLIAEATAVDSGPGRLSNNSLSIVDATVSENQYNLETESFAPGGPEIELKPVSTSEIGIDSTSTVYEGSGYITSSKPYSDFVTKENIKANSLVTAVVIPPGEESYNVFTTTDNISQNKLASSGIDYYNNPNQIGSSTFIAPSTKKYNFRVNGFNGSSSETGEFKVYVYVTDDPDSYEANQWIMDALHKGKNLPMGSRTASTAGIEANLDTYVDIDTYPIKANKGDKITVNIDLKDGGKSSDFNIGFYTNYYTSNEHTNADGSGIDFNLNYDRSDRMNPKTVKSGEKTCMATWIVPDNASEQCFITVQRKEKDPRMGNKVNYHLTATKVSAKDMKSDPYESSGDYQNDFINYGGGVCKPGEIVNGIGSGAIDNQLDVDWFAYKAEKTGSISVTMDGEADLAIYRNGAVRTINDKIATFDVEKDKVYYIAAYAKNYTSALINNPGYTINVGGRASISDLKYLSEVKFAQENVMSFVLNLHPEKGQRKMTARLWVNWEGDSQQYEKSKLTNILIPANSSKINITMPGFKVMSSEKNLHSVIKVYDGNGQQVAEGDITNIVQNLGGKLAPQELVFDQHPVDENGRENHYIFIDAPEHIGTNNILNNSDGDLSRTLYHNENLAPGKYTIFEFHHKEISGNGDHPFTDSDRLYYNSVFYNKDNSVGRIKVNKLGVSAHCENPHHNDDSDDNRTSWAMQRTWHGFADLTGDNFPRQYDFIDPGIQRLDSTSSLWLTDMLDYNIIQISKNADMGYVWLMMEFEVLDGPICYSSMALKNSYNFTEFFDRNKLRATFDVLKDQVHKGIGEFDQVLEADPMEFFIDDSIPKDTPLTFSMSNKMFPHIEESAGFNTNTSPLYYDCNQRTPDSAALALHYDNAYYIDPYSGEEKQDTLYFNAYRSPFLIRKEIPTLVQIEPYNGKKYFEPNEEFDEEWVKALAGINYSPFEDSDNKKEAEDFSKIIDGTTMQGYGVTYRYTITVHNGGQIQRWLVHHEDLIRGYYINYSGDYNYYHQLYAGWGADINDDYYSGNTASIPLPPGQSVTFTVESTQFSGSKATNKNDFIIKDYDVLAVN